jgi:ribonuclease-3
MTLQDFQQQNNVVFSNQLLLEQAFIHRSFINENPRSQVHHNERLEFLGDAVLELVVTEFLYSKYPHHNEGDLTAYRSALVNAVTLGDVATSLGFNELIRLSKGEAKDVHRARSSILADAYEAVVGAMYLDLGYATAHSFIARTLLIKTEEIIRKGLYKDAKSFVQEKSQEIYNFTPTYKVEGEEGPDHDKLFEVAIFFGDEKIATGNGKSKQEAETQAARNALVAKGWVSAT